MYLWTLYIHIRRNKTVSDRCWLWSALLLGIVALITFPTVALAQISIPEGSNPSQPQMQLTPKEKAWLVNHPDIKLGFTDAFEPALIRNSDNTFSGIVVDFLDEINRRLGTDIGLEVDQWPTILKKVEQNELGGVIAIAPGNANARGMLKTKSHFTGYPTIYGRTSTPFMGPAALTGKKIAYFQAYYLAEKITEPYRDTVEVVHTKTALAALQLVYEGKVDFMVGQTDNNYLVKKYKLSGVRPVHVFRDKVTEFVTGVRSDWPELVSILNKVIASFTREDLNNIYTKWTQIEFPQQEISLTQEEIKWLAEHPVIRVGADPNWAPLEFKDESGAIQGISVDYLKRIRKMLGIEFEFVDKATWGEMLEMTRNAELDLLSSVKRTPSREQFLSFTDSYIELPVAVFNSEELQLFVNLEELSGRKAAVVKGYATEELLIADHPDIILVPTKNAIEALHLLVRGEVDAFVGNLLSTSYYLGQLGYSQIKVAGITPYIYNQRMGVRKDWPLLVSSLQKALGVITMQERNAIKQQWVGVKYIHKYDLSLLWKILGVFAVVFGSIWIFTLKRQIIERKKFEQQLTYSQNRFRAFMENSIEGIWCVEFDEPFDIELAEDEQLEHLFKRGFISEANDAYAESVGFKNGRDLIGSRVETFCSPSSPTNVATFKNWIRNRYLIRDAETIETYKPGNTRNILNNTVPIITDGHLKQVWGTQIDITDRKRAEEKLRYQGMLLENVSDAVVSLDADFKVVSWNTAAEKIYGWKAEEAQGNLFRQLTEIEYIGDKREMILANLDRDGFWSGELRQQKRDGKQISVQSTYSTLKDHAGNTIGYVGINRDITELKAAELKMREQRDILSHMERRETLGQLTGSIAHELNQPLTGVLSAAQAGELLLQQEELDKAQINEIFTDIIADTKRASRIISNLRELFIKEKIEMRPLNINTLISDTLRILNSEFIIQRVTIKTDLSATLPDVVADKIQIQQVLLNLINNALQAMQHADNTDRWLSFRTSMLNNGQVAVCLDDNGPGIEPDRLRSIFNPLETTKEDGMGMGLSICKSIVQTHGGRVWAESNPNGGASFYFTIPSAEVIA